MKKKKFVFSNVIIELNHNYEAQAKELAARLNQTGENGLIAIDCSPNGNLNAFHYDDGLESAAIIKKSAESFLGADLAWFEKIINASKKSAFKTNFKIGEEARLWERVRYDNYREKLDWTQPFCVKNDRGRTRAWYPNWPTLGYKKGFSTKGEIIKFINESVAYVQKFYLPLPVSNQPINQRMHYRLVFHTDSRGIDFIGGLWLSRSEFKIFLAKDTVVGLISPERL